MSSNLKTAPEKRAYSIPETAAILGISRNLGYKLAAEGQIPTINLGRRKVVPRVAIDRLLEGGQQ